MVKSLIIDSEPKKFKSKQDLHLGALVITEAGQEDETDINQSVPAQKLVLNIKKTTSKFHSANNSPTGKIS
jgi:hypothetical protein